MEPGTAVTRVADAPTPALVVDVTAFEHNLATMAAAVPGRRLRPHAKAHKTTAIARRQREHGHPAFTCATPREVVGLAAAGLGDDLLLANETVDAARLRAMAQAPARVTVAVDSERTIAAAADAGIREVLVDVEVGMHRCGCPPSEAGALADLARARGLSVRGVMGYEGHAQLVPEREKRAHMCERAMEELRVAHDAVGGEVVSAGGTGTHDLNTFATEIQAGSYALLDTAYTPIVPAFRPALCLVGTVISVHVDRAVADVGLKALGMDHGGPEIEDATVWYVADEHVVFTPGQPLRVGERVVVRPAHVDPTVAYHERIVVADGPGLDAAVVDEWEVDLRGW
jgi:D-serine deaminase-like pyridoxal phosphate-dependent protein